MQKQNNYSNNYPNITDIQNKILNIIKENPEISVKQISLLIKENTYDGIRWNIVELKRKGILERKGTTRKGMWIIK